MQICISHSIAAFEELAHLWQDLLARAPGVSPFMRPTWLRTWWEHFGEGELHLVTFKEEGRLVGLIPLRRIARDGQWILETFGEEVTDYLDPLVEPGWEEAVIQVFLAWLTRPEAPGWDAVLLWNTREDSALFPLWPGAAAAHGLTAHVEQLAICPMIPLPPTWEAYLQLLDRKDRHELRRKIHRLEAVEDARWYLLQWDGPEADEAIEAFLTLMAASHPEKAAFLHERMRAFFRQVIRQGLREGWARLSFLEIEGKKAAAFLDFEDRDRIWLYNAGLNPRYAGLSPGVVLLAYLIRQAIAQGKQVFDLLRGDEPYKFRFGAREVPLHRIRIARDRPAGDRTSPASAS
ncbi:MAG: GNAT family N-acetyltransferase [Thermoflexus sp.]|jgi:CelD/BcsL family acetyltransferase involved in cellulose biosynthesis|nr:GNAT family N-acetyltransferase [Thermoflexus sp.]